MALGCLALASLGVRHARIQLKGDSLTSLSWSKSGRFVGNLCTRTAIILMVTCVLYDYTIVDAIHVPGDQNVTCDNLSRMVTSPADLGYPPLQILDCIPGSPLGDCLHLCDPTVPSPFLSEEGFTTFWTMARTSISQLGL